jgi:hypothetical protein
MLTCKFFNDFIGRDPELCKDFELVLKDETFEIPNYIRSFTRRVSSIDLQIVSRENFVEISALLTSIGQTVAEMKLHGCPDVKLFWQLISLTPNVEKLDVSNFGSQNPTLSPIPHKFKKLRTLKLDTSSEFLAAIFAETIYLNYLTDYSYKILKLKK